MSSVLSLKEARPYRAFVCIYWSGEGFHSRKKSFSTVFDREFEALLHSKRGEELRRHHYNFKHILLPRMPTSPSIVSSGASPFPRERWDSAVSLARTPSSLVNTASTDKELIVSPTNSTTATAVAPTAVTESPSVAQPKPQTFTSSVEQPGTSSNPSVHPRLYSILLASGWNALTKSSESQYKAEARKNVLEAEQKREEELKQQQISEAQRYPDGKPIVLPPDKQRDDVDLDSLYSGSSREATESQKSSASSTSSSDSSGASTSSEPESRGTGIQKRLMRKMRRVTRLLTGEPVPTMTEATASQEVIVPSGAAKESTVQVSKKPGVLKRFVIWLVSSEPCQGHHMG